MAPRPTTLQPRCLRETEEDGAERRCQKVDTANRPQTSNSLARFSPRRKTAFRGLSGS
jgi:hypothetical protein